MLLSMLTQLNLGAALSRFIGSAQRAQRALVGWCYLVALGCSLGVAVMIVGVAALRNGAIVSGADWMIVAALAAGVPLWTAFALQEVRGPDQAAFIGLPWTVVTVALLAILALALALLVELSAPEADVGRVLVKARRFILTLVPLCATAALLSYPVLLVAGPDYAARGFLLLALVPAAATETTTALLRLRGRPGAETGVQLSRAAVLLGATTALALLDQLWLLGAAVMLSYAVGWAGSEFVLRRRPGAAHRLIGSRHGSQERA